jgi:glycosyltransferase involved in cell wall biosynthesis
VRKHDIRALWSTYPITSAHTIGYRLSRRTGLPWVVDFRDNMVDADYPTPGPKRALYEQLEARWVKAATRIILTTESARELCRSRHPEEPAGKWLVIRNGYDEENFAKVERTLPARTQPRTRAVLVHSGLLVPSERNPAPFFEALRELRAEGFVDATRLSVVLRGSGHDEQYRRLVERNGIEDLIEFGPPISHYAALAEMLAADGLLIFQGRTCNHLVPAKLYEYMRAGRPVLALTDAAGETAEIMKACGLNSIVDMDSAPAIAAGLRAFLGAMREGRAQGARPAEAQRFSRRSQASELARLLDGIA